MKYKIGDRVRIKSIDWYNKNKNHCGEIPLFKPSGLFVPDMSRYCNNIMTIKDICYGTCYRMKEDFWNYNWTDEMIEGLVEDETVHNKWTGLKVELELSKTVIGVSNVESLRGERFMSGFVKAIIPPEGYIFKDENGNVINATKIVLEKKKKEYPKTFEECVHVLEGENRMSLELMNTFRKLIDSRNAYWKIAGEEMGLRKPWKPKLDNNEMIYYIYNVRGKVCECEALEFENQIFAFPTEEMRDAFYENFKSEIEICKELL